jgi:hypothetical protein
MDKPMRQSPTSTANIAYMLGEMKALIQQLSERFDSNMSQISARLDKIDDWREKTEGRLSNGAQNFVHITARLDRIESERYIRQDDVENAIRTVVLQSLREELKAAAAEDKKEKESEGQSITFRYLVDKLMIPVLSSVISALVTGALIFYLVSGG